MRIPHLPQPKSRFGYSRAGPKRIEGADGKPLEAALKEKVLEALRSGKVQTEGLTLPEKKRIFGPTNSAPAC